MLREKAFNWLLPILATGIRVDAGRRAGRRCDAARRAGQASSASTASTAATVTAFASSVGCQWGVTRRLTADPAAEVAEQERADRPRDECDAERDERG